MIMEKDICKFVAFIQLRSVIESLRVARRFIGRSWSELCKEYNSKRIWYKSPDGKKMVKAVFESGFGESDFKRMSQYSHWDGKSADDIKKVFYALFNLAEFLKSLL